MSDSERHTDQKLDAYLEAQVGEDPLVDYAWNFKPLPVIVGGVGDITGNAPLSNVLHEGAENARYSHRPRFVIVAGLPGVGKTDATQNYVKPVLKRQCEEYRTWHKHYFGSDIDVNLTFINWDMQENLVKTLQKVTKELHDRKDTLRNDIPGVYWIQDETGLSKRPFPAGTLELISSMARMPSNPNILDIKEFNRLADEFLSCIPIPGEPYQDEFLAFTRQKIANEITRALQHEKQQNNKKIPTRTVIGLDILAFTAASIQYRSTHADFDELAKMTNSWTPQGVEEHRNYADEIIYDILQKKGFMHDENAADISVIALFPSPRLLLLVRFREYLLQLKARNLSDEETLHQANSAAEAFKLKGFGSIDQLKNVQEGGSLQQIYKAWDLSEKLVASINASQLSQVYSYQFGPVIRLLKDVSPSDDDIRLTEEGLIMKHPDFRQIIKDAYIVGSIIGEQPKEIIRRIGNHLILAIKMDQDIARMVDPLATSSRTPFRNIHHAVSRDNIGSTIYSLLLNEPSLRIFDESNADDIARLKQFIQDQLS